MVESKKVRAKETEEEKEGKKLVEKVVKELLKGDGSERSDNGLKAKFNGTLEISKRADNGLKAKLNGDRPRGGCP